MANTMRDYSEKRDFHRMRVNTPVEISDSQGRQLEGICKDLSGTGMQLAVQDAMPVGTQLQTRLPSSNDRFPPLEATVEVLRCELDESGDGYLVGAAIQEIKR
ncbi:MULTISPECIES: PilZ domain-containing protein [Marinobacter]|uniref:PilZ domain-containing protein n=1 Tax=Marinobacter TaxID=2742 RepID=UPI001D1723EC|nr:MULTISPECIES: PilZ domain-containing protein [Marinobacter]